MYKRILILLLASAVCLFGQGLSLKNPAFVASLKAPTSSAAPFDPTNIPGTTNLSWWVADNIGATGTNTSGQVSNWVDAGLSPQNLTNLAASAKWGTNIKAGLNGHDYVHFDVNASQYLTSANFATAQPYTHLIVYRWISVTNQARYLLDGKGANSGYIKVNTGRWQIHGGTVVNLGPIITNKWQIMEVVLNGTSSAMFTNAPSSGLPISTGAVSAGTSAANGLTLADVNTLGASSGDCDVAEVITLFGTLGAIDTAGTTSVAPNRLNAWNYLATKYPDALAP